MRKLSATLLLLVMTLGVAVGIARPVNNPKEVTVAILAPVEIPAMNEIIAGLKSELTKKYSAKVNFIIKNAQGDANLMRSELQQINANSDITVVAPIGTKPAQMAMTIINNKPIVAIAADYTAQEVAHAKNSDFTTLHDDPSPAKQFAFIHSAMPQLKKVTLVHSDAQRMLTESALAIKIAKKYGITVEPIMIHQLSDLYSVSQQLPADSQAIYILQDEMVVSGIKALLKQAEARHIPVIASDDGSVKFGAAFALGVKQREIGIEGADLILQVLRGTPAKSIPMRHMTKYSLFINLKAAKQQGVVSSKLEAVAKQQGYPVEKIAHEEE